jgi:hypothetical protein
MGVVFALAEVLGAKEFGGAEDARALAGGLGGQFEGVP